MTDLSLLGIIARLGFIKMMSHIASEHFPEVMGKTLLTRAGWMFPKVYACVTPFMDADQKAKVMMFNGVPEEELLAAVPKETWPKEYGGNGPCMPIPRCSRKS